jgi:hypothetical protein
MNDGNKEPKRRELAYWAGSGHLHSQIASTQVMPGGGLGLGDGVREGEAARLGEGLIGARLGEALAGARLGDALAGARLMAGMAEAAGR